MGSGNIPSAVANTTIKATDHNAIRSAMVGDYVPRDASANASDEAGNMGQSSFRWLQGYIKSLFLGSVADNVSIVVDGGDAVVNVGGVERARIPQSVGLLPTGMVVAFSGSADVAEWLICDGREVDRTTYARLFNAIGTIYGEGNSTSTFNIPDFRGEFLRGADDAGTIAGARGKDPDAGTRTAMNAGGASGNTVGSIQDHELDSHDHEISPDKSGHAGGGGVTLVASDQQQSVPRTAFTGGNETRPTNAYVNYIIKL